MHPQKVRKRECPLLTIILLNRTLSHDLLGQRQLMKTAGKDQITKGIELGQHTFRKQI